MWSDDILVMNLDSDCNDCFILTCVSCDGDVCFDCEDENACFVVDYIDEFGVYDSCL